MTDVERMTAELAALRESGRMFAKLASRYGRVMEAALIELHQNGAETAMRWILNASEPPADEGDGLGWDGRESARQWFDRVMTADAAATAVGTPCGSKPRRVTVNKAALETFTDMARAAWGQRDQEFCAGTAEFAVSAAEFEALVAALDIEE